MWKLILILGFIIHCTIGDNCQTGQNGQNGLKITEVKTPKIDLAAYPVWDEHTHSLYFVNFLQDSTKPAIYRYSIIDGTLYSAVIPGSQTVTFLNPVRQGCTACTDLFAVGSGHDIIYVKWDGKSPQAQIVGPKLLTVEPDQPLTHTNIAQADRYGRVYEGPFSLQFCDAPANQSLYRYTDKRGLERLFTGFRATSGLAIDEDRGKLYHVGACNLHITEFDYDPKTGDICNGRVVFDFHSIGKHVGTFFPLSLAVDSNGLLYTTDYRSSVYVIDPRSNSVARVIDMGVKAISGLAFGGPKRNILFVLAASIIVDTRNFQVLEVNNEGSSLYTVSGLCTTGQKVDSFKLPNPCNGC